MMLIFKVVFFFNGKWFRLKKIYIFGKVSPFPYSMASYIATPIHYLTLFMQLQYRARTCYFRQCHPGTESEKSRCPGQNSDVRIYIYIYIYIALK